MFLTRYGVSACGLGLAATIVLLPSSDAFAAGNVSVSVDGRDNLVVTGDGLANDITINDTATSGVFLVTGNDGTTINGGASDEVGVADRDFIIELGGGSDNLEIVGVDLLKKLNVSVNLKITDDAGDNTILIDTVLVSKRVKIILGDGANTVDIVDSDLTKNSKIQTGDGIDTITIDGGSFRGGIKTNDSNDVITVMNTGQFKNVLKIISGNDDDSIEVTNVEYERKVLVNAGPGFDTVTIGQIDVGKKARMIGGPNDDTLIDNGGHASTPGTVQPENKQFEIFGP
ncbi:MAG: hypothetical protein ACI8TX_000342 [Hyphomicrobiaceae bacterium]|jgi:hypothetical protein